jgi:hypothetical protein
MDNVSLPNINRAASENSIFFSNNGRVATPAGNPKSAYELKMEKLAAMYFPEIDSGGSVKSRLSGLEETAISQSQFNKLNQQTLNSLSENLDTVDLNIKGLILSMQVDFDSRLASLKKEYDHR